MHNTHSLVEKLQTHIKYEKGKFSSITKSKIQDLKLLCCLPAQDRSVCFLVDLPDMPNNLA